MRSWLKRIRGAIGVGLTWAVGWGLFSGLWWLVATWSEFGFEVAQRLGLQSAVVGFFGGVTFATMLRLTEGRRRFDELRIPRFAAWGALGGFLIGAVYAGVLIILAGPVPPGWGAALAQWLATTTFLGAGSAAGSLAIARVADDRQLLNAGVETAEVGLSQYEKGKLLGDPDVTTN